MMMMMVIIIIIIIMMMMMMMMMMMTTMTMTIACPELTMTIRSMGAAKCYLRLGLHYCIALRLFLDLFSRNMRDHELTNLDWD